MTTSEDWAIHARWQLGKATDAEYADHLETYDESDQPPLSSLIADLRGRKEPMTPAERKAVGGLFDIGNAS